MFRFNMTEQPVSPDAIRLRRLLLFLVVGPTFQMDKRMYMKNQSIGESKMRAQAFKGCMGLLLLVAAFGVYAQGGGGPVSPAQASAIVARQDSDKQTAAKVFSAVVGAGVDGSKLKVRAYKGVVTLRGSVPGADQVQTASATAATVPGVKAVKNRLGVRQ
jgi:hyperosmotically inducible periplasmic protein